MENVEWRTFNFFQFEIFDRNCVPTHGCSETAFLELLLLIRMFLELLASVQIRVAFICRSILLLELKALSQLAHCVQSTFWSRLNCIGPEAIWCRNPWGERCCKRCQTTREMLLSFELASIRYRQTYVIFT